MGDRFKNPLVWIFVLFLAAILLLVYAASIPLLVKVFLKDTKVVTLDPEVVIGLVGVVFAVLGLAGAGVYFVLTNQVRERVRSEIETSMRVVHALVYSYMGYLEYSKTWTDTNFAYTIQHNLRFQSVVSLAVRSARTALDRAKSIPGGGGIYKIHATNALAYHQATNYLIKGVETDRLEATRLATELQQEAGNDASLWETIAWVTVICHSRGSQEFLQGQQIIESLLRRDDLPHDWRGLVYQKYKNLFRLDLPHP